MLKNFFEKKFEKNFWKKNCDLHITLARVHSVQIFKSSRLLHHSVIMLYDTKNDEKRRSLRKRGLVTTVQPKPEFSRTCGFREVLGINEDCSNAKFCQNP